MPKGVRQERREGVCQVQIVLETADNGFIMRIPAEHDEDKDIMYVFQEEEDDADDIEPFRQLLSMILHHMGPTTSRYSEKRIYIEVRPGDKYEPPKDDESKGHDL